MTPTTAADKVKAIIESWESATNHAPVGEWSVDIFLNSSEGSRLVVELGEDEKDGGDKFVKGYLCAVCNLIKMNGLVTTEARELFNESGAAKMNIRQLREMGVDSNDIEVIGKYWANLYGV